MKKVKVLSESWKDELDKYRIGQMENEDEPYSYAWLVNVSDAGDHVAKNNWMYLASLFGYTSKDLEPYFDKQASKEGISAEDLDAKGKSLAMADFLNDEGYQAKVVKGFGTEIGYPKQNEGLHEDEDSNVIDRTGGYTLSRRPDGEKVNQWHSKYVIDNPGRIADLLVHGDDQTGYTVETSVYMPQQMRTDELKRYLDDLNTILSIAKKFEDDIKKAESK